MRYSDGVRVGKPGFNSKQKQESFLHSTSSRPTVGLNHPPIQCVLGALSPAVKRLRREAHHSLPYNAEVKKGGAILPLPHMSTRRRTQLYRYIKSRTNFLCDKHFLRKLVSLILLSNKTG
jgi:hypothetical protein